MTSPSRTRMIFVAIMACAWLLSSTSTAQAQVVGSRSKMTIETFVNILSSQGNWHRNEQWGWVWQPRNAPPWWRPYASGTWIATKDFGMVWHSYESFGWAVYHYGRWVHQPDEGWFWVPDTEWGPGWVSWRAGNGYVGWAPMPPKSPGDFGVSIEDGCGTPPQSWLFVPENQLLTANVIHVTLPIPRNVNLIGHTDCETRYSFEGGVSTDRSIPQDVLQRAAHGYPYRPVQMVGSPSVPLNNPGSTALLLFAPVISGHMPLNRDLSGTNQSLIDPSQTPFPPAVQAEHRRMLENYHHAELDRMHQMQVDDLQRPPLPGMSREQLAAWHRAEHAQYTSMIQGQRRQLDNDHKDHYENEPTGTGADDAGDGSS